METILVVSGFGIVYQSGNHSMLDCWMVVQLGSLIEVGVVGLAV